MNGITPIFIFTFFLLTSPGWAGDYSYQGNGTLVDNNTGLTWQQQDDGNVRNWKDALSYCENLSLAGKADWRLPNIKELESIIAVERHTPAIDLEAFPGTKTAGYWSSTPFANNFNFAWFVYFNNGYVNPVNKAHEYYTRCARSNRVLDKKLMPQGGSNNRR